MHLLRTDGGLPPPPCVIELVNLSSLETVSLACEGAAVSDTMHTFLLPFAELERVFGTQHAEGWVVARQIALYMYSASGVGFFAPGARAPAAAGG